MGDAKSHLQEAIAERYAVECEIGRGGMAIVYLAHDLKHHRQVALKVLKPELVPSFGADRFLREIEIAAQLTHPNILPLYDSGEADGLLYYVMPYVQGETLRDRLKRERQLPVDESVQVAREIADALAYAHSLGLIHRDIKPANVLFQAGHALVADFGIARALSPSADRTGGQLTESGIAVGTLAYMSPEQAVGSRDVDGRTDIYSLGCVLYEMLTGELPLSAASSADLATGPAADLRRLRPAVPSPLAAVVARALARLPVDRFGTAAEFSDAVGRSLTQPVVRTRAEIRRRSSLVAALTVALFGGGYLVIRAAPWRSPSLNSIAVLPLQNLSKDPEQEYFVDGMHDALITELASISGLRVISRTSTLRFRNTSEPLPDIASELGVSAVVEGSVMKEGDSVRIQVQLIQARPRERQLWSKTFDRQTRAVLALQSQVAQEIAHEVGVRLTARESAAFSTSHDVDPLAYEELLRGRRAARANTPAALDEAMLHYEAAVRRDPDFALAHMAISGVWSLRARMGLLPADEAFRRAEPSLLRARELDSTMVEVRLALAEVRLWQWDWRGAERELHRVVEANPNNASALATYAMQLAAGGRFSEAAELMSRALALDPLNPGVIGRSGILAEFQNRYDEAARRFHSLVRMQANLAVAHWGLWSVLHEKRQFAEALLELKAFFMVYGDSAAVAALERGHITGGYPTALRRAADVLTGRSGVAYARPYTIATLYARAGDANLALDWLERSFDGRDVDLRYLAVAPGFESLRGNPRLESLLRRMHLTTADR